MARQKNEIPSTQAISLRVSTENKMWLDFNATNKNKMINLGIHLIRMLCEREPLILRYIDINKDLPPTSLQIEKKDKRLVDTIANSEFDSTTCVTAILNMIV